MPTKALQQQSKELVSLLIHYFERERDHGGPLLPLNCVRERVCEALQLGVTTVSSISASIKRGEVLAGPSKQKERQKTVRSVDNASAMAIRNSIYEMYQEKQHITVATLLNVLTQREIYNGSQSTLCKILHDIGFKWNKNDPRRGLMEVPHIALLRMTFLREYVRNTENHSREFVYLDETWIFENGTVTRSWQDDNVKTVKKLKGEGKRFIIIHAGTQNGFVPGASLIFSSNTKNPDYHGEMNQTNFLQWFENQLLENLENPSLIVMDNARYHSSIEKTTPTTTWKKAQIQQWLTNNDIMYDSELLKPQLLLLVKKYKPPNTYIADKLAEQYGHKVLRLPPYHCIFNPIENVSGKNLFQSTYRTRW